MKFFYFFLILYQTQEYTTEKGLTGITIAPPPMPQEILPPKPIIVAPLLVKQHRRKHKMAIYHTGPPMPPLGYQVPPTYPGPGMNGLNMRKLMQQVNFHHTSLDVPSYMS